MAGQPPPTDPTIPPIIIPSGTSTAPSSLVTAPGAPTTATPTTAVTSAASVPSTQTRSMPATTTATPPPASSSDNGISVVKLVAIVVPIAVVLLILPLIYFLWVRRRTKRENRRNARANKPTPPPIPPKPEPLHSLSMESRRPFSRHDSTSLLNPYAQGNRQPRETRETKEAGFLRLTPQQLGKTGSNESFMGDYMQRVSRGRPSSELERLPSPTLPSPGLPQLNNQESWPLSDMSPSQHQQPPPPYKSLPVPMRPHSPSSSNYTSNRTSMQPILPGQTHAITTPDQSAAVSPRIGANSPRQSPRVPQNAQIASQQYHQQLSALQQQQQQKQKQHQQQSQSRQPQRQASPPRKTQQPAPPAPQSLQAPSQPPAFISTPYEDPSSTRHKKRESDAISELSYDPRRSRRQSQRDADEESIISALSPDDASETFHFSNLG